MLFTSSRKIDIAHRILDLELAWIHYIIAHFLRVYYECTCEISVACYNYYKNVKSVQSLC